MKKKITGTLLCTAVAVALVLTSIGAAETAQAASLGEQAGATMEQPSAIPTFEGPYDVESQNGQTAVAYKIINVTGNDIYAGITAEFMNSSNQSIGTSSAFVPSIASGESAYIYAVNNSGQEFANRNALYVYGTSSYASATDALSEPTITEENGSLTFSSANTSSNAVYLPQITVVYKLNSSPIAVYSGMLSDGTGGIYLSAGSTGTVSIACPAEYDDYEYYVTAIYDTAVSVPNTGASDAATSTGESGNVEAEASGEVEPGTNQADAGQMTLGVPVNETIEKGEYFWYQFTTGDEEDATYYITTIDKTTDRSVVYTNIYDKLQEEMGKGNASENGTPNIITCTGLSPNTTYYIRINVYDSYGYADSTDFQINVEKAAE